MSDEEIYRAQKKIVRLLSTRLHSRKELLLKLLRTFSPEVVEKAFLWAVEENLIVDEEKIAEQVVGELDRKLKGDIYIRLYLRKKGLPEVSLSESKEWERARQLLLKMTSKEVTMDQQKFREKAAQKLQARGYTSSCIRRIIYEELRN